MQQVTGNTIRHRKALLIFWASAILWLYVGNLVNFHQHHIWGKQLIPFACTSRSKEKAITAQAEFIKISNDLSHQGEAILSQDGHIHMVPCLVGEIIDSPSFEIIQGHSHSTLLRGPPAA